MLILASAGAVLADVSSLTEKAVPDSTDNFVIFDDQNSPYRTTYSDLATAIGGSVSTGPWSTLGDTIFPTDLSKNVGIGTNTANYDLHVLGDSIGLEWDSVGNAKIKTIVDTDGTSSYAQNFLSAGDYEGYLSQYAPSYHTGDSHDQWAGSLVLETIGPNMYFEGNGYPFKFIWDNDSAGNIPLMTLFSTGPSAIPSLGIGTTSTNQTLDVNGSVYINGNLGIGTINPAQAADIKGTVWATGFKANGNVGISTTCPMSSNWVITNGLVTACH